MSKMLLYCTKAKPYLTRNDLLDENAHWYKHWQLVGELAKKHIYGDTPILNGKIVGECDFEVEEIKYRFGYYNMGDWFESYILKKACLSAEELDRYLQASKNYDENKVPNPCGYAIHIKNLEIYDEPRDLSEYSKKVEHCKCDKCLDHCKHYYAKNNITHTTNTDCTKYTILYKAPQNMMYVFDLEEKKVLTSIRPEWLVKILNGEKTIEVRKKVLKEMLK